MAHPPRSTRPPRDASKLMVCSEWLYLRLLRLYPASFQRAYGLRMARIFRDSCRDTLQQRGSGGLPGLWLHTLLDLLLNAGLERWLALKEGTHAMAAHLPVRAFPLRLWLALVATLIAFVVALVASLNLYLIEDSSALTAAAYNASPLLRFSYDGIYLSALAAGVAVCAIAGYALIRRALLVSAGLAVLALLVVLGGFGGLLVRHPLTFLAFLVAFSGLLLVSFFPGRAVMTRAARRLAPQPAAVLGACTGAGVLLFVNVAALVLHTLILNPVSHELYMQGQIAGTHFNFSLITMVLAAITLLASVLCLSRALRLPMSHPDF